MKRFKHMHPRLTAILVDGLTVILMLLAWLFILGIGLHVWAAPAPADVRIRDGVNTAAWTAEEAEPEVEPEPVNRYALTAEDEALLCQVALAEAGYRDPYSQACVMQVIMNRVADGRFPNTVSGVVYQPHQFSTAGFLSRFNPEDARAGLELLQSGAAEHNALAFCTTSFSWATYAFSVGGNNYFTF